METNTLMLKLGAQTMTIIIVYQELLQTATIWTQWALNYIVKSTTP